MQKKLNDERKREALAKPEVRAKMSESAKNRVRVPEQEVARIEAMRRPEARAKQSASQKERFTDPDQRRATSEATKAAMARPDVQQRLSEGTREAWTRPEMRQRFSEAASKRWEKPEEHQKTSEATKAAMVDVTSRPEYQAALRSGMERLWNDPEYMTKWVAAIQASLTPEVLEKRALAIAKANGSKERTSIEIIVANFLSTLEIEYEEQKLIGRYIADFYIPSKNLVVECDGDYWHSERKPGSLERDAKKDAYLSQREYNIIRLREKQIRSGNLESLTKFLEIVDQ